MSSVLPTCGAENSGTAVVFLLFESTDPMLVFIAAELEVDALGQALGRTLAFFGAAAFAAVDFATALGPGAFDPWFW